MYMPQATTAENSVSAHSDASQNGYWRYHSRYEPANAIRYSPPMASATPVRRRMLTLSNASSAATPAHSDTAEGMSSATAIAVGHRRRNHSAADEAAPIPASMAKASSGHSATTRGPCTTGFSGCRPPSQIG